MPDIRVSRNNAGVLESKTIDSANLASHTAAGWVYPAVNNLSNFPAPVTVCRTLLDLRAIVAEDRKVASVLEASYRGLYLFDHFSSASESLPSVVAPDVGVGRWILVAQLDAGGGGGSVADGSLGTVKLGGDITASAKTLLTRSGVLPLFIQDTDPAIVGAKYLWLQTGLGDGSDFSLWFNDGT